MRWTSSVMVRLVAMPQCQASQKPWAQTPASPPAESQPPAPGEDGRAGTCATVMEGQEQGANEHGIAVFAHMRQTAEEAWIKQN